jgi:aminopeptidase N
LLNGSSVYYKLSKLANKYKQLPIINMIKLVKIFLPLFCLLIIQHSLAQPLNQKGKFTNQDTLRGSITPERAWWNVREYKLFVEPNFANKTISGSVTIVYDVPKDPAKNIRMQIDLQEPMHINRVYFPKEKIGGPTPPGKTIQQQELDFTRNGNVYYISGAPAETQSSITIEFSGSPRIARNPPWDGGWIFTQDAQGRPWMTVACQGLGASVWYPCKDHQSDEPDQGAIISIKVPSDLVAVANGTLVSKLPKDGNTIWEWQVKNPINNYNIVPYIGHYINWHDEFTGETNKPLSLDYWVLDYDQSKAKKQFDRDVKAMLKCFEYWFGPYPFYEDGYKLVEAPHLGMEHQSAVAYGNHFMNGYLGMDLSGTGWGKNWDYIIVHESGHEWFANNITTNDIADMWVHEGFTDYAEVLFVECQFGKKAGDEYCQGLRGNIRNDMPIIGYYGVNQEGSGDMYAKGANMLHTIRQVISNDSSFRAILRGLNKKFYHQTVDSKQVEEYMSQQSGKDLSKIFDQYLRTIKIPEFEYKIEGKKLSYHWSNCVDGFNMPLEIADEANTWIYPSTNWQTMDLPSNFSTDNINKNFYITLKKLN